MQVTALVKGMLVLNPALKAPYAEPYASCETREDIEALDRNRHCIQSMH